MMKQIVVKPQSPVNQSKTGIAMHVQIGKTTNWVLQVAALTGREARRRTEKQTSMVETRGFITQNGVNTMIYSLC